MNEALIKMLEEYNGVIKLQSEIPGYVGVTHYLGEWIVNHIDDDSTPTRLYKGKDIAEALRVAKEKLEEGE